MQGSEPLGLESGVVRLVEYDARWPACFAVDEGGPLWRDYLAVRDYLRAHAADARELADVKRVLASCHPQDREADLRAKSAQVERILRLARASAAYDSACCCWRTGRCSQRAA